MASVTELFRRLERFEETQKELKAHNDKLELTINDLRKEIEEVRGIASQLKLYFDTLSEQNKHLMSPSANQSEVSMSEILKLVRELKDV
jgi:archaellum component FlaC